jgi:hypothetical protein
MVNPERFYYRKAITMIRLTKGNLLRAETEALINTVNCVGHMGKGIALQFKKSFPDNFIYYQKACRDGEMFGCNDICEYSLRPAFGVPLRNLTNGMSRYP